MDHNELLQSVEVLIDAKLELIKQEQQSIRQELAEIKEDQGIMWKGITEIKSEQRIMRNELTEVRELAIKTAMMLENVILPKLQLIFENQVSIMEQNEWFKATNSRLDNVEADVAVLQCAYKELKPSS